MNTTQKLFGNFRSCKSLRILFIALGIILFISAISLADGNSTNSSSSSTAIDYVRLNTTSDAAVYNEIHSGGNVSSYNYIAANGSVDVYVNGDNIDSTTKQLANYISSNQGSWSQDSSGMSMGGLLNALQRIAEYKAGKTSSLSDMDTALMNYLEIIYSGDTQAYVQGSLAPRDSALNAYHDAIQKNMYDIEAIYRTLEQTDDADIYCKSRIEVAQKYNLSSVKCGLHSKMCYNGNLDTSEDGRDFCVHTDNDIDYIPCYNTFGRCGSIVNLSVQPSEEDSFIPVKLTYSNPGAMNLSPSIKIDLQKIDSSEVVATKTENLGSLLTSEQKSYETLLNTTGVIPGKYDLWVTVISGRKEILQEYNYTILPAGTIAKVGEFSINSADKSADGSVKVVGSYKNTKDLPYMVDINAEFYRKGENASVETQEKKIYVQPGETKDVNFDYNGNISGNYSIVETVKGTTMARSYSFAIEPKSPDVNTTTTNPAGNLVGNFMLYAPQIYTGAAIAAIAVAFVAMILVIRKAFSKSNDDSHIEGELV